MSKLYVKEFGPIKSGLSELGGWLDFPKVTLFCGQQASGKSSVAKLFSIMSWMEKQIYRDPELVLDETFFAHAIEWHGIESYLRPNTEIRYRGELLHFDFVEGKVSASQVFDTNHLFVVPKISYMPAERNFASIVRNASRVEGLPNPLVDMQVEFGKARRFYQKGYKLPANGFQFIFDNEPWIINGNGENASRTRLDSASSGLQSMVPLLLVSEYLAANLMDDDFRSMMGLFYDSGSAENKLRLEMRRNEIMNNPDLTSEQKRGRLEQLVEPGKRFVNIVEEPEQNLYPETQCDLVTRLLVIANARKGSSLIVTTHSPYVHNHLILVAQAAAVLAKSGSDSDVAEKVSKIIPNDACISGDDMAIYELHGNGSIHKLEPINGLPSDDNPMNRQLSLFNSRFADILEAQDD